MECEAWRDAISALADGEDPGVAPQLLERHVAQCAGCRAFREDIDATRQAMRLQVAPAMPDVSGQVVKANAVADRTSRWMLLRAMLGLVACQIIVLSFPALLFGDQSGASPHGARHLGAFTIAYAVGLLVVAVRPARARTVLAVAQVLCGAIVLSTIVDVLDGATGVRAELVHLPELVSLVLLWILAVPPLTTRRGAFGLRPLSRRQSRQAAQRRAG